MGATDVLVRQYMSDPERFADAFNYMAYDGKQVINPDDLKPMPTVSVHTEERGGKSGTTAGERRRDGFAQWQIMRDEHAAYAILGIEDQTYIDHAMPARCMLYDALSYMEQIKKLQKANRKSGGLDSDEWLSGLRKSDRLLPVATLVVHFGSKTWDGPLTLGAMLSPVDEDLMALVPDYQINLLTPSGVSAAELSKFHTELGLVLGYIKYAQDKNELATYVRSEERFRNVGAETAGLLNALTDSRLEYDPGEERVDMCKAIEDMRAEALEQGMRQGMERGTLKALSDLVRDGVLTLADAAARAGLDPDEFRARASAL